MSGAVVVWSAGEIACDVVVGPSGGMPSRFVAATDYDAVQDAIAEANLEADALRVERDRARDVAARLEGEIARVRAVVVDARSRAADKPEREWMRMVSPTWEHGTVGYVVHRRDDQVYLSSQTFGLWFDAAELEPADDPEWEPTEWTEAYVDACDEILQRIDDIDDPDAEVGT